ncbi:hypothetical protein BASA84_001318 [Batrachochytrium salamandrivorans]|nr:hypothetical protein BASA84_001318 [Batrachochytrium salamandrivorans]
MRPAVTQHIHCSSRGGVWTSSWPSHSVWTSTSNSEITTQTTGSQHSIRVMMEYKYLAPRWNLKWRSRSGPALVGRDCGA